MLFYCIIRRKLEYFYLRLSHPKVIPCEQVIAIHIPFQYKLFYPPPPKLSLFPIFCHLKSFNCQVTHLAIAVFFVLNFIFNSFVILFSPHSALLVKKK